MLQGEKKASWVRWDTCMQVLAQVHCILHPEHKLSNTSNLCCSENALLVLTATETGKRTPVGLFAM